MSNFVQQNRIGIFRISQAMVLRDPADALAALDGCIVVRAETHFDGSVEYVAFHPTFDPVDQGAKAPEYRAIVRGGRRNFEPVLR